MDQNNWTKHVFSPLQNTLVFSKRVLRASNAPFYLTWKNQVEKIILGGFIGKNRPKIAVFEIYPVLNLTLDNLRNRKFWSFFANKVAQNGFFDLIFSCWVERCMHLRLTELFLKKSTCFGEEKKRVLSNYFGPKIDLKCR